MGGVGGDVGKCVEVWGRSGELWEEIWGVWGRCKEMCWGVGGGKERCVGSGEVWGGCGKVYGVSGEVCWRVGKGCGERNGEDVGKCVEVWGPNTLLIPHISLPSPFPTSPLTSPTPHHTFLHLLSYLFPHPSFLPHSPTYFPTIPTHLPSPSQSVAKLPCDEVSVAKLLWRSYHVAKLLATVSTYMLIIFRLSHAHKACNLFILNLCL